MRWRSIIKGVERHHNGGLSIMSTEPPRCPPPPVLSIYKTVNWIKRDIQQTAINLIINIIQYNSFVFLF